MSKGAEKKKTLMRTFLSYKIFYTIFYHKRTRVRLHKWHKTDLKNIVNLAEKRGKFLVQYFGSPNIDRAYIKRKDNKI